jgi:SAM-dependent methyltransferase
MRRPEPQQRYPRAKAYVDRHDYILRLCAGKDVLDVGFVGEVCAGPEQQVDRFAHSLHLHVREVARSLTGVDIDADAIRRIQAVCTDLVCVAGNIEDIELIPGAPFDVIVAGDILEHMDGPGKALDNLRRFLKPAGRLVVSVPNAFGLPNYLRFLAGRFTDSPDHVHTYTRFTITNALRRHGYDVEEVCTALDRLPRSRARRAAYAILKQPLKLFPELGGTLLVVTRPSGSGTAERVTPQREETLS